jgi:hypothetical protein
MEWMAEAKQYEANVLSKRHSMESAANEIHEIGAKFVFFIGKHFVEAESGLS